MVPQMVPQTEMVQMVPQTEMVPFDGGADDGSGDDPAAARARPVRGRRVFGASHMLCAALLAAVSRR
jgi:hypothetical protein